MERLLSVTSRPGGVDVEHVVRAAVGALRGACVEAGRYRRYVTSGGDPRIGYGTAAAANVLYTLDLLPTDPRERAAFVATLRAGQSPQTGLFADPDHGPVHATANVVAALHLFGARPEYPLSGVAELLAGNAVARTLDGLDWIASPWGASHVGAGSYAALHVVDELPPGAADAYFGWLWDEQDPGTGLWRHGCQPGQADGSAPLFHHLAGSFHYLFNHVAAARPWRYPAAMIDTALALHRDGAYPLGAEPGFAEIDWVYCLTRSVRQCGHRADEVEQVLRHFTHRYAQALGGVVFDDLHTLHGTLAALAELQQALPGALRTERPLRLTLDRRPFL